MSSIAQTRWLSRNLCTAIYKITSSVILWCYSDVMHYGGVPSLGVVLTRNDLKHAVLLHVGGEVPSSHVLLHYANVGQLLMGERNTGGRTHTIKKVCFHQKIFFFLSGDAMTDNRFFCFVLFWFFFKYNTKVCQKHFLLVQKKKTGRGRGNGE